MESEAVVTGKSPHVLVAGAGIGGLALALSLLRNGVKVSVFEQAPELRPLGAGLQISPNGTKLLAHLGLSDDLRDAVCEASRKEVRLWNTGETWPLFNLGEDCIARFGAPYWTIHRGDLHTALFDAVERTRPGTVHLNKAVTGFAQDANGVCLQLQDGTSAEGSVLVGADGVHSVIRSAMGITDSPHFTGMMAWRGLAKAEDVPPEMRKNVGVNWVGPGRHFITYPVRQGQLINLVGIVEGSAWLAESWNIQGTTEEWKSDFSGWSPLIMESIEAVETPFKWAFMARDPISAWSHGRVTLLGDAAHPTLPFLAQGSNMALEDAIILSRCLTSTDPDHALLRYDRLRIERTTAIVKGSKVMAERFHNPALAEQESAVAYISQEWQPDLVRTRYDWLFEYDALLVA